MAVSDWDRRELCPDGSCTGLIGPEGTCKVCGRVAPNWGDERKRGIADDDDDDGAEDDDVDATPDPVKPATKVSIGGGEWAARTLCADGGCVGVIGQDGLCKVCGKPGVAPAVASEAADDELAEDEEWVDDDDGEDDEADDEADDELAAAADDLAGVASPEEVASAKQVARAADADDDDDRALCPDGGCIGVIGADGKCKVCGKEAAA